MKGIPRGFVVFLLLATGVPVLAQRHEYYTTELAVYRDALDLYDKQKYASSRLKFEEFLTKGLDIRDERVANAHYYIAVCAMELFNDDADELLRYFIKTYPESPRTNYAEFQLGKFYYRNKKWEDAIVHYQLVEANRLTKAELAEYHFKLGYALFQEERYDEAYGHFEACMDMESEYSAPSSYYFAHIAYQKGYYQVALERFLKISADKRFSAIVPYYIAQIYYSQRNFDKLIAYAIPILDTVKLQKGAEIARMVGQAHFESQHYDEAVPFLDRYQKESTPSRHDKYMLGFCLYQSRQYARAITVLSRVTGPRDTLSQAAYYHLGDCYLKQDEKPAARTAFREASEMDIDKVIQEDALYNYAVLAFELSYNPFDEAISAFEKYINMYPNSSRRDEAYTYLLRVYMTTKNYEAAMKSIENVAHKDILVKSAYQMIAYNRGVELFHNQKYGQAIEMLQKVKRYPLDVKLNAGSKYWIAESIYRQYKADDASTKSKLDAAIGAYRDFMGEGGASRFEHYVLANYNIGYCYLKKKDYAQAIESFRKFVEDAKGLTGLGKYVNDGYLRIGDAYFMTLENDKAIDFYEKAIAMNEPNADYAWFQKAMALGYKQKFNEKIAALQSLIQKFSRSNYNANARYEIAESYRVMDQRNKALEFYQQVIELYPSNMLVRKALTSSALIHYKDRNYAKAEQLYLKVLADYPNPEDCRIAIDGLKDVYTSMDRIEEWERVLSNTTCAGYGEGDIDSTFFNSAKNLYFEGQCAKAIESFDKYLKRFPKGVFVTDAHYYKAECLVTDGKEDEALVSYDEVLKAPVGKFTESALARASDINYRQKRYQAAMEQFVKLERISTYDVNIRASRIGLMRCYYYLKDYVNTLKYTELVLRETGIEDLVKSQAHFFTGMSLKETGKLDEALAKLRYTNSISKNIIGAEAKYNAAHVLFLQQKFKESESEIFEMVQQKPAYDYWLAKAYILLSDNYVEMGDLFQAKETLKSIIQYYTATDDIVPTAQEKLNAILEMETDDSGGRKMENVMEIENDGGGNGEEEYRDLDKDKKNEEQPKEEERP
jgi:TolA-binding protein